MQRAQIEWTKKGQDRLNYINNEIMKEHKAEIKFANLNAAMQQYFLVTGRQLESLPPKPVLSHFYIPFKDQHNRALTFITLSNCWSNSEKLILFTTGNVEGSDYCYIGDLGKIWFEKKTHLTGCIGEIIAFYETLNEHET